MADSIFTIRYGIDDGYAGGDRPQSFQFHDSDLEDDMDDEALERLYYEAIQTDFEQKISPYGKNIGEFMEWAREKIKQWDENDGGENGRFA